MDYILVVSFAIILLTQRNTNMKKIRQLLFGVIASIFAFGMMSCNGGSSKTKTTIDIYALNDFHGAFNYVQNSYTGLSRIGKYLMDEKTKNPDSTIIISSGDMWQGSVESNLNHGALVTEAMNTIGFDSMTIGNHEFDWGEDYIKTNQAAMKFPLLACNIFYAGTTNRPEYLKPYTVITKGAYKIGIIGAVKEKMGTSILRSISNKFDFPNPVSYVKEYSDILYNDEKCDAVILSTHDGDNTVYSTLNDTSTKSNKPYINGLFLAHDHQVKNDFNGTIPYVEGGSSGAHIAHIGFTLESNKVSGAYGQVISTSTHCLINSTEVDAVYAKYKDSIEKIENEVVGYCPEYLSRTKVSKAAGQAIVNHINENLDEFGFKVTYGTINSGGARNTLPAGKITYGDLVRCLPFDNFIVEVNLSETQLAAYMADYSYPYSYQTAPILKDTDGLYHLGTINYLSEIMDNKGNNTSSVTSSSIIRDVLKDQIAKNQITSIVPYTGQPDPETGVEPDMKEATVEEFIAADYEDETPLYKYHVVGIISKWDGTNTDGTQYGDFYLKSLTSDTEVFIYGCSAARTCLVYNVSRYVFTNPKDYLTNEVTSSLKVGDKVSMELIRNDYRGVIEGVGIMNGLAA
jgi:5''-nucleotidase/2'',3''-cyclic phosphodiesterase and related esterases